MSRQTPIVLPCLAVCVSLLATTAAHSAQYIVDEFALGNKVSISQNYQAYTCKPSDDFAEAVRCQREQQTRTGRNTSTVSKTLIHGEDGTVVYVMSNTAPVAMSRTDAQVDINSLSRDIGARPVRVTWLPKDSAKATSAIAVWGQVKLVEVTGDPLFELGQGNSPHIGVLVDTLGDLKKSAEQNLPIYRMVGSSGFVYAANFGPQGHRHYVAIDAAALAIRQFQKSLEGVLKRDELLASDDYSLWPEVATAARRLALDTSPQTAKVQIDRAFEKSSSKKLYSHVWPALPGGPILHLADGEFWPIDIYGPETKYPQIRRDLQNVISETPADHFLEFAYYVLGDFDKALATNQRSIISSPIHYARGHRIIEAIVGDAVAFVNSHKKESIQNPDGVIDGIMYLRANAETYDGKVLVNFVPRFETRAATAKHEFEAVVINKAAHHADDAAYFLGWLAYQQGKAKDALPYLSQALVTGNGDYQGAALRLAVRILQENPSAEQYRIVENDPNFSKQPTLWYAAARSAYREYNYEATIKVVEAALRAMNIPLDRLPATTDPDRISEAIGRINPELRDNPNFVELPYLLQSSREFLDYDSYLKSGATEHPDVLIKRARTIILKYSMLTDPPDQPAHPPPLAHQDPRLALALIDATLNKVPKEQVYASLRQWLYYRKVRTYACWMERIQRRTGEYAIPDLQVPDLRGLAVIISNAITALEQEFSSSKLLDDVLAEQLRAQGVTMADVGGAERTFRTLVQKYPNGNAVDNAYSWMGILYRCAGRTQEALNINREILRRFPLTRHANYARERMANPGHDQCGLEVFNDSS